MHPRVCQWWKSLREPKIVINSPCNRPDSTKIASVDDQDLDAPWVRQWWKSLREPKIVINSPCNGPELAKTARVDDQNVNAPLGMSMVEIAPGTQNGD